MARRLSSIIGGSVLAGSAATAVTASAAESPLPAAEFSVSATWPLAGSGGWDYLAVGPDGSRLFVTRGDRVDVVDIASGTLAGTIPNTAGVHGVAFAPEMQRGYTSNGAANTVTAFELDTLRTVLEAPVAGLKPDAILYEPQHRHVVTANGASANLSVLDPATLRGVASVKMPGKPEFMVTDAAGTLYVNIETVPGRLVAVDTATFKVRSTWTLAGCNSPTGLALDAIHHRLFSACENGVMAVTDSGSGRQIARVPIGAGPDGAAYDPALGFVFTSNGEDGTLTVIHQASPDRYRVVATLQTQKSARTLALETATHKIYLAAAQPGNEPRRMIPDSFVILVAQPK